MKIFSIRKASQDDAKIICDVTRKSIIRGCVKDHKHDESIKVDWLRNKTPENFRNWITTKDNLSLVAIDSAGKPVGFILAKMNKSKAELLLNYIEPEYVRQGVGYGMYNELEQALMRRGVDEITANSTITARDFYLRVGFTLISENTEPGDRQADILMGKFLGVAKLGG